MHRLPRPIGHYFGERLWAPVVGNVCFGDFGRTKPISNDYGFDRGKPLDRYYIEQTVEESPDGCVAEFSRSAAPNIRGSSEPNRL